MNIVWKHLGFVISSIVTLTLESVKYLVTRDQLALVTNLANGLLCRNIFYVKFLQAISSDCQLLDAPSLEYLSQYADNVAHEPEEVDNVTLKKLTDNGVRVKSEGDEYLVANAGMVSLVYRGEVTVDNKSVDVAVKVMRNGIRSKLEVALEEIEALVHVLSYFPSLRALNIDAMFTENKTGLLEQLDFVKETENINVLHDMNKRIDYVAVPCTYPAFSKGCEDSAIIMDYLTGRKLADLDPEDKAPYSACLAKFDIKCLLFDGTYHGDFHQGNILFMGDRHSPCIGVIDMGVICTLTREEQNDFFQFFHALLKRDYDAAASSILRTSAEPRDRVETIIATDSHTVVSKLADMLKTVVEEFGGCGVTDINGLNNVLREHGLRLTKLFCKVQLSLALAEGVHRGLETERNFIEELDAACRNMFPTGLA
jgi:predicted unusual protein kinase regulating ubiquinone biosynthesis (AarF/ABC1/UbiB family)